MARDDEWLPAEWLPYVSKEQRLLTDVWIYVDAHPQAERFDGRELAVWLRALEGRPWAAMGKRGEPITAVGVARLLGRLGICPVVERCGGRRVEWYSRAVLASGRDRE